MFIIKIVSYKEFYLIKVMSLIIFTFIFFSNSVFSWSNHTLIAYPVFSNMVEVTKSKKVKVETLEEFLFTNEKELEKYLFESEIWYKNNLFYYPPLPKDLYFKATGNPKDIKRRFLKAVRLNLKSKFIPYIQYLPGTKRKLTNRLRPQDAVTFKNAFSLFSYKLNRLKSGEYVKPLDVIVSANDEPDFGLDIGLYENNNSEEGKTYGFGKQPFGNPNLSFGTQAPIHIGFYHASKIVYKAAPNFGRTLPEYRIQMYRRLASFAFSKGHDYWGWRFIGLGLHYVGDFTNPYHVTMSPGTSTFKLMWENLFMLLGRPKGTKDLIQLSSNRHLILEKFQGNIMSKAYINNNLKHPTFLALKNIEEVGKFTKDYPVEVFAKKSWEQSQKVVDVLLENMPKKFVNDPNFEVNNKPETSMIDDVILRDKGIKAYKNIEKLICELLKMYGPHARSYVRSALKHRPSK
jgi:hypothetical protein